jgi:hypothetical protein
MNRARGSLAAPPGSPHLSTSGGSLQPSLHPIWQVLLQKNVCRQTKPFGKLNYNTYTNDRLGARPHLIIDNVERAMQTQTMMPATARRDSRRTRVPGNGSHDSRRASPNPVTTDVSYEPDQVEFLRAVDAYKNRTGRKFLTLSETFAVFRGLGYRKVQISGG